MRSLVVSAVVSIGFAACAACAPQPLPTSTTPATPGSAVILPSPATAEQVPRSTPAPGAPAAGPSAVGPAPSASASAPTQ